jgi:DNA-binding PadR family transcriptional regulator
VDDPLPNGTMHERNAYALTEQGRRVLKRKALGVFLHELKT